MTTATGLRGWTLITCASEGLGREFAMPQSRGVRIGLGVALCFLGLLGFLPVLGFWMIPLGLFVR